MPDPKIKRTKKLGKLLQTSRGFDLIEFTDMYGESCSLQASSLARPAVWLGCNNNAKPHHVTGDAMSPRMHLDRKQVQALVVHLQTWLTNESFG